MAKERVLSGLRPTGEVHLGNLLGALNNWVELQNKHDCLFMVADLHALSSEYADSKGIRRNIRENVIDWLAAGLDVEKCTIFLQSRVPEHAQLHLVLSMITPLGWLERNPTYKEQKDELRDKDLSTYGFLGYPVLQTADIILYKATLVPVGEDQLPHLELAREIVRRFNNLYGKVFLEPKPILTHVPKLLGIDNRKMSKSYRNYIALTDSSDTIREKVLQMITDPARIKRNDPGHPEICNVYSYHNCFSEEKISKLAEDCRTAKIGCTDCKGMLAESLINYLKGLHERRSSIKDDPKKIDEILEEGGKRARGIASTTLKEAMAAMGM
ncbi:tryptophan--tRNA ligase [candidate division NPL-UPA2 bacterium]|nr:tryptophan--tRNA ligase [candidate division NPL-UPA2 bacterium]